MHKWCKPKSAAINTVGFVFFSISTAFAAVDGKLGKLIRGLIGNREKLALPMAFDKYFRQLINSTRPIWTQEDMLGMRFRGSSPEVTGRAFSRTSGFCPPRSISAKFTPPCRRKSSRDGRSHCLPSNRQGFRMMCKIVLWPTEYGKHYCCWPNERRGNACPNRCARS
jgi:hypothetical protein